jgi:hypothetical protein
MTTIENVLGRISNWKMRSAYNASIEVDNFPPLASVILKEMAERFENCGWQDGTAFKPLEDAIDELDNILTPLIKNG